MISQTVPLLSASLTVPTMYDLPSENPEEARKTTSISVRRKNQIDTSWWDFAEISQPDLER